MSEEELRKCADEETMKQIMDSLDGSIIFTYIQNLEKELEKQKQVITEKEQLINDMRKFLLKTNMMCDFLEWRNKDE